MDAPALVPGRDYPLGGPHRNTARWVRAGIGVLALAGLDGCDSGSAPECSFFSNTCNPTVGGLPGVELASVAPRRLALQAGSQAVFAADTTVQQPSYQWQRSTDGGVSFTDIPGATASTLTLSSVRLSDDGTVLRVVAKGTDSSSATATSTLLVSSMPGVVFSDAEFVVGDWAVAAVATPSQDGPTHGEAQQATGGNPGAWRQMSHALSSGPSTLLVFHSPSLAVYDPASQGPIHAIDYGEDCIRQADSTSTATVLAMLSIAQAGRHYAAPPASCQLSGWSALPPVHALRAADFAIVDGSPCGAGESCPDFGAQAAPLQFGYARQTSLGAGAAAGTVVHGIDNWKVTVWRQ